MEKDKEGRNGSKRFKFPPSPQGTSKIHEDLASSQHQLGSAANGNGPTMLKRLAPIGRNINVGIVGGGVAGMRCAEVLLRHGVKVTVIEARDRLGGRLGQGTLKGGHLVDLGPNWIHGTENNPMMDLARETGTVTFEWGENQTYIDSDKSIVPPEQTRHAAEFAWETITEAFKESNTRFSAGSDQAIVADKSLADFFDEKIKQLCGDTTDPKTVNKAKLLKKASKFFGPFTGQPVEEQSLKFFWLEECLEGETLFCADSYFKILQHLSGPVKRNATVLYNCEVKDVFARNDKLGGRFSPSLQYCPGVVDAHASDNGQTQEVEFDEVVVTTPLGWLKQHQDSFHPSLPDQISDAIKALGYGTLDKVYITFTKAWWNDHVKHDISVPPTESQQKGPNMTAMTAPIHQKAVCDTTSDRIIAEDTNYPGFTTFLQPEYAKDTNSTMQNQEICNLAALPGSSAQPTLLFYIYGEFGKAIGDAVASLPPRSLNEPASEDYMAALWTYFKPYISQLPGYDVESPACKPIDMLATVWTNDKYAGNGSYTNFPTGLERGDENVVALREGLPDGGIWFAGEHTAPFVALGTVTGAYWSGEAVARRILNAYGLGDTQKDVTSKQGDGTTNGDTVQN